MYPKEMIVFKQYTAIAELCTETIFIGDILNFLGLRIRRATTIFCDNAATIFLSHNTKSGARTKHINVKYNIVRVCSRWTVFVHSEENDADVSPRLVGTHLKNNNENHVHN